MFEFLRNKKNHFIGIDFGTSAVKVVELSYKDHKVFLENYGLVSLERFSRDGAKSASSMKTSYEQKLGFSLKKLKEKMKLKSDSAFVSIPGFSGLITIIELPEMPRGELDKALQFEAHKYIPSSLEEIAMSWEVIEHEKVSEVPISQALGKGAENKKIKVLLVAAPKKDIERYDKLVADGELKVSAIELETFSLIRALIGNDAGNFLIVDIGARVTSIVLVEKGVVLVNRSIDAGGDEITTSISENMNISKQRAEDFKKGEKDLLNGKESYLVIPILEFVINESKRILNAYQAKNKDIRIDGVLLSGGTSKMKGIEEYFTNALNIKTTLGNPWRRIGTQENVQPFVKNLGGSFTIALGLALRGVEEYKRE